MAADGSLLTMTGPFGPDVRPVAFRAVEEISAPFAFSLDFTSPDQAIDPDRALTQAVSVTIATGTGAPRHFHGLVRSLRAGGADRRGAWTYTAEIVPAFWFARQTMDCRVFLKKSVVDILETLFSENGVTPHRMSVQGDRPPRDHVLQFNETDFDFASRLMEEEGYFYFFEHSETAHTLVVANSNQAFSTRLEHTLSVVPTGRNIDVLGTWSRGVTTASGKWRLLDYDLVNPDTPVDGSQNTVLKTPRAAQRDMLAWPAREYVSGDALSRARLRQEAAESEAALYDGAGSNPGLAPGVRFTIEQDPVTGNSNEEYVARSVQHAAFDESDMGGGAIWRYENQLSAFPFATTWRETPRFARPVMAGLYAATVLTPPGEDIEVDQYGRIKVRLKFDHRGDATSNTTIWARVLQPWASNTWGWQHIPRSGDEVAVAFVDADPDRPIVVGSLANAQKMPVFSLPDQKTKTGLRTRSTLQGGTSDFSEFSFEDKKGQELVFLHAQKDHSIEVENDETHHIMHDHKITVDNDRTRKTGAVETVTIGQGRSTEITQKNESLVVKQGDISVKASLGAIAHEAMKSYTIASKTDAIGLSALRDITVDSKTGAMKITAMQSIELSVMGGMASIKIEPSGITVKGMMVKLAGDIMTEVKGLMTTVKGDAMTMVKGAIMMLN